MLIVTFLNDATGDKVIGHYDYQVRLNHKIIAEGKIRNHNRLSGWQGLMRHFGKILEKEERENHSR